MMMPGRKYSAGSLYRYGFNGKEDDKEIKGDGVQYDYGFRIYDSRIAKFLSVDPLQKKYPELTPYQFASNSPIQGVDLDGREIFYYAMVENPKTGEALLAPLRTEPLEGRGNKNIRRYVVTYEDILAGKTRKYHIGFPQYGVGYANTWKTEDFERDYIKKKGDYILFMYNYTDDESSQAASDVSTVVNTQNVSAEHSIPMAGGEETPTRSMNKTTAAAHGGEVAAANANAAATSSEALLTSKAKVFSAGGSIGMLDNAMELNVNSQTKRLTGSLILNDKTVFFEGTVSTENGVLTIKNVGIRNEAGDYNNTDLVNEIGPGKFKKLIDELKELRINGGYKDGTLEFERMKPEGSKQKDREKTSMKL
jgi:RHS repeat-associated protein